MLTTSLNALLAAQADAACGTGYDEREMRCPLRQTTLVAGAGGASRFPAVWLVLLGMASVQLGSTVAKSLFDELTPTSLVWMRLLTSVVLLAQLVRPRVRRRSRAEWVAVLAFGATIAVMNWSIYQSFARIPIGIAVSIESPAPSPSRY